MLAYVFWHRPRVGVDAPAYEAAQLAFHASLEREPPAGPRGSLVTRVQGLPWLAADEYSAGEHGAGYEDWYLLEDYAALGVLGEAAVGRGHRTAHDGAARSFGSGAGGLYGLIEGDGRSQSVIGSSVVAWVSRAPGSAQRHPIEELLGDGMDPARSSLWRRQLVLGPAPELCLLSRETPAGVSPQRLPAGWSCVIGTREGL